MLWEQTHSTCAVPNICSSLADYSINFSFPPFVLHQEGAGRTNAQHRVPIPSWWNAMLCSSWLYIFLLPINTSAAQMCNSRNLISSHLQPGRMQVHRAAKIMCFQTQILKNIQCGHNFTFFNPNFITAPQLHLSCSKASLRDSSWKVCQPCFSGAEKYLLFKQAGLESS